MRTLRSIAVAAALVGCLIGGSAIAVAGNTTLFSPRTGDVNFPFTAPTTDPAAAGLIDNMTIGATTPRAGTFTTGTFTTIISSAPVTAPDAVCATITPAAAVDAAFYIAPRAMLVTSARQIHSVAAGGTSVLQITKDTGTNAPGAGTDLLSAGFNLNATANTVQVGALIATAATKTLAAGDRLSIDFADAIQSSAGIVVTVCMSPQ